ncbi:MAG: hypothetical protein H6608_06365 [Flavobacteriales bacterium]|nr:hypothetical protein [Bacteroidota bacterium]MCB9240733.1 hypothetical protein [Flavobacteriales bacterium]
MQHQLISNGLTEQPILYKMPNYLLHFVIAFVGFMYSNTILWAQKSTTSFEIELLTHSGDYNNDLATIFEHSVPPVPTWTNRGISFKYHLPNGLFFCLIRQKEYSELYNTNYYKNWPNGKVTSRPVTWAYKTHFIGLGYSLNALEHLKIPIWASYGRRSMTTAHEIKYPIEPLQVHYRTGQLVSMMAINLSPRYYFFPNNRLSAGMFVQYNVLQRRLNTWLVGASISTQFNIKFDKDMFRIRRLSSSHSNSP